MRNPFKYVVAEINSVPFVNFVDTVEYVQQLYIAKSLKIQLIW